MGLFNRNKRKEEETQEQMRPEDVPVGIYVKDFSMIKGKSTMSTVVSDLYHDAANYAQTWGFRIVKISDPEPMRMNQMQLTAIFEKLPTDKANEMPSNNPEI